MPRFGKDKDARKEELDRQAAEEVERLTRRGGPPSAMGGGMPGMGGPSISMPSPLERIADELRGAPRPSMRQQAARRTAPKPPQQAFTPMPSGSVGSSFGPGGLNPGPRTGVTAPPPPAFGGGAYDEDYGGHVTGPPVYNAGEPDEEEEMTITEMALMDHAAHTGHNPEDLVIQYDAGSAEEMRDAAMRKFYERQQARGPGVQTNNPFAPAGMRSGPTGAGPARRGDDPATAGGALAQRLANKRRREEEEARRAQAASQPPAAPAGPTAARAPARSEPAADDGALSRVLARRRRSLGMDAPEEQPRPAAPGRRHAEHREETSPGMRVPLQPLAGEGVPTLEDMAGAVPRKPPAKRKAAAAKAPAAKRAAKAPPSKAATSKAPVSKGPASKAPAKKAPAARTKATSVFCIECGEKNPAIAKFCFNCGTRLAAPGG